MHVGCTAICNQLTTQQRGIHIPVGRTRQLSCAEYSCSRGLRVRSIQLVSSPLKSRRLRSSCTEVRVLSIPQALFPRPFIVHIVRNPCAVSCGESQFSRTKSVMLMHMEVNRQHACYQFTAARCNTEEPSSCKNSTIDEHAALLVCLLALCCDVLFHGIQS